MCVYITLKKSISYFGYYKMKTCSLFRNMFHICMYVDHNLKCLKMNAKCIHAEPRID